MFSWTVASKRSHGPAWYAGAGILVVSLAIWGFLTGIYALSVAVVILAGVYLLVENNSPESVEAVVNENGVGIDQSFYDYGQIEDFSLMFDGKVARFLIVKLKKRALRILSIPLGQDVNPSELRAFLQGFLPEGAQGELTFADRLSERLGL